MFYPSSLHPFFDTIQLSVSSFFTCFWAQRHRTNVTTTGNRCADAPAAATALVRGMLSKRQWTNAATAGLRRRRGHFAIPPERPRSLHLGPSDDYSNSNIYIYIYELCICLRYLRQNSAVAWEWLIISTRVCVAICRCSAHLGTEREDSVAERRGHVRENSFDKGVCGFATCVVLRQAPKGVVLLCRHYPKWNQKGIKHKQNGTKRIPNGPKGLLKTSPVEQKPNKSRTWCAWMRFGTFRN